MCAEYADEVQQWKWQRPAADLQIVLLAVRQEVRLDRTVEI
jgi:hypothetical protein